ncbi:MULTISPECIES: aldehyde dehydrogenase family protein [unclassified Bradyrhizobium]|nr:MULTISPECIES: aldehyde dehydrogenase family protein [unclassified Bradyrhizobium]
MGQTCVCANHPDEFVQKQSKKVAATKIGNGRKVGRDRALLINMKAVAKIERHIANAVKRAAKVETGGRRHGDMRWAARFFEPTPLADVTPNSLNSSRWRRHLAPLAPVIRFKGQIHVNATCNASFVRACLLFLPPRSRPRLARRGRAGIGMVGANTGLIAIVPSAASRKAGWKNACKSEPPGCEHRAAHF